MSWVFYNHQVLTGLKEGDTCATYIVYKPKFGHYKTQFELVNSISSMTKDGNFKLQTGNLEKAFLDILIQPCQCNLYLSSKATQ